jgi:NAD(P)-dependent dehydrogenase (short-subunit alcohol dehydrogenase family)
MFDGSIKCLYILSYLTEVEQSVAETDLTNAVVAVTGASKGIGLAAARAFSRAGARVVMLARSADRLAVEAEGVGDRAMPIAADVGNPNDVRRAFAMIEAEFGGLDVLVNNAGVAVLSNIEDATDEQIAQSVGTNLLGPVYTTRAAIPLFKKRGRGDVINISTESTLSPFPFLGLYAATKAGMETFSKASLSELKPLGVRVTVVLCGPTMTEFGTDWNAEVLARFIDAAQASGHLASSSAGQPMDPDDVANALVFIATRPPNQIVDVMHVRAHSRVASETVEDLAAAHAPAPSAGRDVTR